MWDRHPACHCLPVIAFLIIALIRTGQHLQQADWLVALIASFLADDAMTTGPRKHGILKRLADAIDENARKRDLRLVRSCNSSFDQWN